jgi:hypothetical protein
MVSVMIEEIQIPNLKTQDPNNKTQISNHKLQVVFFGSWDLVLGAFVHKIQIIKLKSQITNSRQFSLVLGIWFLELFLTNLFAFL